MTRVLAADLGATNARFALVERADLAASIPVRVVTNEKLGLLGAAYAAAVPGSAGL